MKRNCSGFTLIELLVVAATIAVLTAMMLPALSKAKARAKIAACSNSLRQLGTVIALYADDFDSQVPQGLGALYGSLGCHYYAYATDDRAGQFLNYDNVPTGLGLLFQAGYISHARQFYCPAAEPTVYGGYRASQGWNPSGGPNRTTAYPVSSYYYRYAGGTAKAGVIADCGGVNKVEKYNATIDNLMHVAPAAVWDSVHDLGTCCGTLNPGYHQTGYNILFYDGSVLFMTADKWPRFPANIWYDSTDCWGFGSPTFWTYADKVR